MATNSGIDRIMRERGGKTAANVSNDVRRSDGAIHETSGGKGKGDMNRPDDDDAKQEDKPDEAITPAVQHNIPDIAFGETPDRGPLSQVDLKADSDDASTILGAITSALAIF